MDIPQITPEWLELVGFEPLERVGARAWRIAKKDCWQMTLSWMQGGEGFWSGSLGSLKGGMQGNADFLPENRHQVRTLAELFGIELRSEPVAAVNAGAYWCNRCAKHHLVPPAEFHAPPQPAEAATAP